MPGPSAGGVQNGSATRAADDDAAERQVAARDALGEGDHVRAQAEPVDAEPRPEPPERPDHAVGDEEDAVAPAQLLQALQVGRRDPVHAARADHGLGEHRGDPLRADALDLGLERLERVPRHVRRRRDPSGPCRPGWRAIPPMLVPSPWVPW